MVALCSTKYRLSVHICRYSFSKECWIPKSISETNRLCILQNAREYKMQSVRQRREPGRREMMCAKRKIEWTNDWMSEYYLCTYTNAHIRASKSGMIDVAVEIHIFFFVWIRASSSHVVVYVVRSRSVCWSVVAFDALPIPLQCIYIAPPKTLHALNISSSSNSNSNTTHLDSICKIWSQLFYDWFCSVGALWMNEQKRWIETNISLRCTTPKWV